MFQTVASKRSQLVVVCIALLMMCNLIEAEDLDIAENLVVGQEYNFTISGEKLFKIILPREHCWDQPNIMSIKTSLMVSKFEQKTFSSK